MFNRLVLPVCFILAFWGIWDANIEKTEKTVPIKTNVTLTPVLFDDLTKWKQDDFLTALPALRQSCRIRLKESGKWKKICRTLSRKKFKTNESLRSFLEKNFLPYTVNSGQTGIFTGYYVPQLQASFVQTKEFSVPLYGVPNDLTILSLKDFGQTGKISGRIEKNSFKPYFTRREIEKNGIKAPVLAWLKHKADVFILHIQGSGVLIFPDGSEKQFGYAADNGHKFVGIGRLMLQRGLLKSGKTSMNDIRDWLIKYPEKADEIMALNPRYIFFKENEKSGAIGSLGVPLTDKRSLAVDPAYIPLGSFIWLETQNPSFNRLMSAQDTGNAIKGPVRGDFFFGTGIKAFSQASGMKASGRYFILLPR